MSLPKGYKRLEYIQSSGTQYVDSEFVPNENTRCVTVFASTYIPEGLSENLPIYGSAKNYDSNAYEFWLTGKGWCCFGSQAYKNDFGLVANTQYVSDQNKNILTVAGNTYTFNASTFTAPHSLLLLASYRTSGGVIAGDPKAKVNLYSCQIYDNGTLVRDYIPCQNASGAVGLWDDANGVFYGNAGSGAFAVGPVIQAPDKPSGLAHALSVRLVWSAVSGAASYNIYRDGAFVGSSNTPTFVDVSAAENQTYVYAVSAVGQGGEGEPATLTVYTKAGYFEYKPLIESANFQ